MLHIQPLKTLDPPELEPYRTMKRQQEHRARQIFVAEGEKVVSRLLASPFFVESIILPPNWFEKLRPLLEARKEEVQVYLAERDFLEKLVGFTMYQGLLAVGRVPKTITLEGLLEGSRRPMLFAAAEGIHDALNMGALVRNCAAFGAQGLIVGETSSSPFLRRAVRNSMGAIFTTPILEVGNLAETLMALRKRGVRCLAAHPHADQRMLPQADFRSDCCVVFGNEGLGLTARVLEACDEPVAVPMQNGVDSLNVGSAGAVFLYEAARQRGLAGAPA
jgi:tRNA G18 (ribose-2'-O)-methylase SpoU